MTAARVKSAPQRALLQRCVNFVGLSWMQRGLLVLELIAQLQQTGSNSGSIGFAVSQVSYAIFSSRWSHFCTLLFCDGYGPKSVPDHESALLILSTIEMEPSGCVCTDRLSDIPDRPGSVSRLLAFRDVARTVRARFPFALGMQSRTPNTDRLTRRQTTAFQI